MQKSILHTGLICLFAFLGGITSDQLFKSSEAFAQGILNNTQVFNDAYGRRRIDIDTSRSGAPIQDFYGQTGTLRLQLGTYAGDEKPGEEAGLPLVGLSDLQGRLRMLFRLAKGKNQSPVLVMKDSRGKDRVILGTALNDGDEEPFLAYIDKNGTKHMVFGEF